MAIDPPSAAVVKLIGARANSVVPSRSNSACRCDVEEDVEVARRRAARARLAFARQADARAFVDARREC